MSESSTSEVTLNPHYKLILIVVSGSLLASVAAMIVLAGIWTTPTETQKQVIGILDFTAKSTLGAILGLLGAKAT